MLRKGPLFHGPRRYRELNFQNASCRMGGCQDTWRQTGFLLKYNWVVAKLQVDKWVVAKLQVDNWVVAKLQVDKWVVAKLQVDEWASLCSRSFVTHGFLEPTAFPQMFRSQITAFPQIFRSQITFMTQQPISKQCSASMFWIFVVHILLHRLLLLIQGGTNLHFSNVHFVLCQTFGLNHLTPPFHAFLLRPLLSIASALSELKWTITSPKTGQVMQRCHEEQSARSKGAHLSPLYSSSSSSSSSWSCPEGPNLESNLTWNSQSRLKCSITPYRTPHKKGPWWVAYLKFLGTRKGT